MPQADLRNLPPSGNLALTYQETLTSIVRLKSGRQKVADAQLFRRQFTEALKVANEEGRARAYTDDEIREARFAVVAFLDETVLNLRHAIFSEWARRPLQEELFGEHMGGEVFFQKLDRLMRLPDSSHLADVLEVYLLCLTLGYSGRYSVSGRGELAGLIQSLLGRLRRIRGELADFSPSWRPGMDPNLPVGRDRWLHPLLYSAVALVVLALVLFGVYKYSLSSQASALASLAETGMAP